MHTIFLGGARKLQGVHTPGKSVLDTTLYDHMWITIQQNTQTKIVRLAD